jgi:hypothetical protein
MSYNKFQSPIPTDERIARALERIAAALEAQAKPRLEFSAVPPAIGIGSGGITPAAQQAANSKPGDVINVPDIGDVVVHVPEHRLKDHCRDKAAGRDTSYLEEPVGLVGNEMLPVGPAPRRHTIPEDYKPLAKHENCPLMWRETDGSRFCPHGTMLDKSDARWEHDPLHAKYRERTTGHTVADTARARGFDVA